MRSRVFNTDARICTRVNAENHNNTTGLAAIVEILKRKVRHRKVPLEMYMLDVLYTPLPTGKPRALLMGKTAFVC